MDDRREPLYPSQMTLGFIIDPTVAWREAVMPPPITRRLLKYTPSSLLLISESRCLRTVFENSILSNTDGRIVKMKHPYLSRAARRVFSSEKGSSAAKVLSERMLLFPGCGEGRLRVRESSRTPSGSKRSKLAREADFGMLTCPAMERK